jgi:uroporphyrinogen III methyltransferase/synthase
MSAGRVYLIGAGPGDPGLISVRGVQLLSEADVVVYDRDVEALLRWARPEAERIAAGAPAEREMAQDAISMLVADKARDGHVVARLKWGDAFVFDSGGKEALFLHEQGVPFEVVPGIPAAIGGPAYAGIPVTYPGAGDALVLLRGHESDTDAAPDVDWDAIAAIDGTIVCYASGRQVPAVLQALLDHGLPPDQHAALVFNGTLPGQRTVTGTVAELLAQAASGDARPALLVVGKVACLRDHLRWFDERPLFGRRIVVTRSREQAREIVDALENLGAQAIQAPTFRLGSPEDSESVDRAAASIDGYDWILFESANAVARFVGALARGPRDLRALGRVAVCAIGASTADRLLASGIKADLVIPEFRQDAIVDALRSRGTLDGRRVLLVRPDHFRETLAGELANQGASVTDLIAYRIVPESPESPVAQELYRLLLEGKVDAVTFASPTALQHFVALIGQEQAIDLLNTTVVAAIGPVTAAAAAELGIHTTIVPDNFTVSGMVAGLVQHFASTAGQRA